MQSAGENREVPDPEAGADIHDSSDDPVPQDAGSGAHLRFRPTTADYLRINAALVRRSVVTLAMAAYFLATGSITLLLGEPLGVLGVLFGVALGTGIFSVPFVWFTVRRRPDLMLPDVDLVADVAGFKMATKLSTTIQTWSVYRGVRETADAFLLDQGTGRTLFVMKRGVDPAQVDAFRSLLAGAGLRPPRSSLLRPLLAVVAGVAVAAAIPGYAFLQRPVANATISLSATVNGRAVAVHGTTDLPDQSSIVVELVQQDEYDRERAAGAAPDAANSPWVQINYVTVEAGAFTTSFDVPSWPSGRATADAFFWMHAGQPAAAIARFGHDGESMKGSDVLQTADRGRVLDVQTTFLLP